MKIFDSMLITDTKAEKEAQISVVIPVHNQEKTISLLLSNIKEILKSTMRSYEVVTVNDAVSNIRFGVLQKEQNLNPCIKVISYNPNRQRLRCQKDLSYAVIWQYSNFEDGDLDISHSKINDYVKELENCDLVIASKRHPQSKLDAPLSRKFLSRMFNLLVRMAIGIKVKDTQSGSTGKGDALRAIFIIMLVKRYAFDVELLTIATALNLNIKEMPIEISLERSFKVLDIAKMFLDVTSIAYDKNKAMVSQTNNVTIGTRKYLLPLQMNKN